MPEIYYDQVLYIAIGCMRLYLHHTRHWKGAIKELYGASKFIQLHVVFCKCKFITWRGALFVHFESVPYAFVDEARCLTCTFIRSRCLILSSRAEGDASHIHTRRAVSIPCNASLSVHAFDRRRLTHGFRFVMHLYILHL